MGYIIAYTVVLKEDGGIIYCYNAIDIRSRFAISYYFKKVTSENMIIFYKMFKRVFSYNITKWQKDNSCKNLGQFKKVLAKDKNKQVFILPRCPRINAYIVKIQ